MKVCFISEAKSIHTQRWTGSLSQAGCDVHLISSSGAEISGIALHRMPIYSPNPWQQMVNNTRVRRFIIKLAPEVIHVFGLFAISSIRTMSLLRNLKNLVVSVWGSDVAPGDQKETFKQRLIKRYLLNRGDRVIATSEYLARETIKYLKRHQQIDVVPWGVDLDIFRPRDVKQNYGAVTMGFAKRLHYLSGPDILLKAFQYARDRCANKLLLRIAGDGPMKSQLKQEAIQMGLGDSIEWQGWLTSSETLSDFYRSIDLFLMPSRRESFGISAAEASASGLPVIASRIGGIPEIVINGDTGLLVDPDDVAGFGKAIISLVKNENLRMEMGLIGRMRAESKFDWRVSLSSMIDIYYQVAQNRLGF